MSGFPGFLPVSEQFFLISLAETKMLYDVMACFLIGMGL